jgi:hypothetical protein
MFPYYDEDRVYYGLEENEVEGCCAAINVSDFPEPYGDEDEDALMDKDELKKLEKDLKEIITENRKRRLIQIFTNNHQKQTNKILLKLKFKHTAWLDKPKHGRSKIRMWWMEP